jgi:hypothetical protein
MKYFIKVCCYFGWHDWVNPYWFGVPLGDCHWCIGVKYWYIEDKGYYCRHCTVTRGDVSSESIQAWNTKVQEMINSGEIDLSGKH